MDVVHKIEIDASPEMIFDIYEDVAAWPAWDGEVTAVQLPDGLRQGAEGYLKPSHGPKIKIRVTEFTRAKSFMLEGYLPLCRMQFGHIVEPDAEMTTVTHTVGFSGPLAFLFRRLIGNGFDERFPDTLVGLKETSEGGNG